ncbi:MAG: F0F1 ATP synthase subunit epsilon [Terriglobales bacterium]
MLQVEIVTPEHLVVDDEASELTMPGKNGYLGILPGHAPLITELSVGEISYRNAAGQMRFLAVAWGFAEVLPNKVTILAETAEKAEDIDVARAERARVEADAALKAAAGKSEGDYSLLEADLARASTRIAVSKKLNSDVANMVP